MAIARYLFKLIFNCAFEYFEISRTIINPQMIQLLFDEATNLPLQIHSQKANFYTRDHFSFNFIWNHLICNQVRIVNCILYEDENMDVLLKILTQGGNKFLNITYLCVAAH
ncbi:unnamed protein product [Meloidogyne enterolobii]|uniref:Uncharacterized protein n=1 Tax=Meloidogyne enterolobii TaxID=390850 RepID=A0ACB1B5K7_MELEN